MAKQLDKQNPCSICGKEIGRGGIMGTDPGTGKTAKLLRLMMILLQSLRAEKNVFFDTTKKQFLGNAKRVKFWGFGSP